MKKYAYYLPQFHCIPENDKWWGKGFTEWTNVRSAKPLFNGHKQPIVPLYKNYYSLEDVNTLRWQVDLMQKYMIDGMIFYHYYFCGKKLLQRPAELLLENKDIPMNFFFCWANHSWYKSWDGSKQLLQKQIYGNVEDWKNHFEYLLPFFKDKRYLKKDNKPVFMFFIPNFNEKNEIVKYFNNKCIENGFNGICTIDIITEYMSNDEILEYLQSNQVEYVHFREPSVSYNDYKFNWKHFNFRVYNKIGKMTNDFFGCKYVSRIKGDKLIKYMIKRRYDNEHVIRGLFFSWDNTPRHAYRGYIIDEISKESFMRYMDSIKKNDYVFINAWNEWCEGMILEPTEQQHFKYLEWIKEWSEKNENRLDGI